MMSSTPESIAEAKRALDEFMQQNRHAPQPRPRSSGATFQVEGDTDTATHTEDDRERIATEARESARRYCEAKAKNVRPVRQIDESNPAAVEGYRSAMAWLKCKAKSRLKG